MRKLYYLYAMYLFQKNAVYACAQSSKPGNRGLLDRLAICMAVICGIHCLVTPILLVALPIIGTTFWVDQNFHLWMLFLVLPTTCIALISGCRRHKDRWVMTAGTLGLTILLIAFTVERIAYAQSFRALEAGLERSTVMSLSSGEPTVSSEPHVAGGGCCALHPVQSDLSSGQNASTGWIAKHALLNALGGLFLVVGHSRNFLLCRTTHCNHEGDDS